MNYKYNDWHQVEAVAFSPDGKYVAVEHEGLFGLFQFGFSNDVVKVWDMSSGREVASMSNAFTATTSRHNGNRVNAVAFSSDQGNRIKTA